MMCIHVPDVLQIEITPFRVAETGVQTQVCLPDISSHKEPAIDLLSLQTESLIITLLLNENLIQSDVSSSLLSLLLSRCTLLCCPDS